MPPGSPLSPLDPLIPGPPWDTDTRTTSTRLTHGGVRLARHANQIATLALGMWRERKNWWHQDDQWIYNSFQMFQLLMMRWDKIRVIPYGKSQEAPVPELHHHPPNPWGRERRRIIDLDPRRLDHHTNSISRTAPAAVTLHCIFPTA